MIIRHGAHLATELNTSMAAVALYNKDCGFYLQGQGTYLGLLYFC